MDEGPVCGPWIDPEAGSIKDLNGAVPQPTQPVSIEEVNEAIAAAAASDGR